jgi:hypothetical protein
LALYNKYKELLKCDVESKTVSVVTYEVALKRAKKLRKIRR